MIDFSNDNWTDEFNDNQMEQIQLGIKQGLTTEQIKLYANPKLDDYQMLEIRKGLEHGLTIEQAKFCANPTLNGNQIRQIQFGFKDLRRSEI